MSDPTVFTVALEITASVLAWLFFIYTPHIAELESQSKLNHQAEHERLAELSRQADLERLAELEGLAEFKRRAELELERLAVLKRQTELKHQANLEREAELKRLAEDHLKFRRHQARPAPKLPQLPSLLTFSPLPLSLSLPIHSDAPSHHVHRLTNATLRRRPVPTIHEHSDPLPNLNEHVSSTATLPIAFDDHNNNGSEHAVPTQESRLRLEPTVIVPPSPSPSGVSRSDVDEWREVVALGLDEERRRQDQPMLSAVDGRPLPSSSTPVVPPPAVLDEPNPDTLPQTPIYSTDSSVLSTPSSTMSGAKSVVFTPPPQLPPLSKSTNAGANGASGTTGTNASEIGTPQSPPPQTPHTPPPPPQTPHTPPYLLTSSAQHPHHLHHSDLACSFQSSSFSEPFDLVVAESPGPFGSPGLQGSTRPPTSLESPFISLSVPSPPLPISPVPPGAGNGTGRDQRQPLSLLGSASSVMTTTARHSSSLNPPPTSHARSMFYSSTDDGSTARLPPPAVQPDGVLLFFPSEINQQQQHRLASPGIMSPVLSELDFVSEFGGSNDGDIGSESSWSST